MIGDLTNHLWQSTLFAAAAALVVAALRQNRAAVRHAVWVTASWKFLLPFSLLMSLGSQFATAPVQEIARPDLPAVSVAIDQIAQPFSGVFEPTIAATPPARTNWIPVIVGGLWLSGFLGIALTRLRDWRRVRAAVRASTPLTIPGIIGGATDPARIQIRSAPGLLEPGVVGLWRPILLLPADIVQHLTLPQLEGILAHEMWHVRRRDNLTATVHMLVEAVFWFHPLVWWIGARIVDERERACDEYVLDLFGEPHEYAQGILNVCKLYVESPIVCVSGVSGANLKRRIETIMINRIGRNLNPIRKTGLAVVAAGAVAAPFLVGMITAPVRASFQAATSAEAPATRQKFDVVSVKPCKDEPAAPTGARQGGPGASNASPGRISIPCATVEALINTAYLRYGERLLNDSGNGGDYKRIAGGPSWTRSDKYTIEARADGTPDAKVMLGPMLQSVLEDRFQLKIHREEEQRPMYALTVTKSGLKIRPIGPDGCKAADRAGMESLDRDPLGHVAAVLAGETPTCGNMTMATDEGLRKWVIGGTTLENFANTLTGAMDRRVLDKTGVPDKFNIRLSFAPDEHTPAPVARPPVNPPDAAGPSIFEALDQQLGLKLEPTRGLAGYLVIDRVERPSPDRAPTVAEATVGKPASAQAAVSRQTFEVASIKPCEPQPVPPGGRSGGGNGSFSPGRAYLSCFVVRNLIDMAYVQQRVRGGEDDPLLNWPRPMAAGAAGEAQRIRGGASWVYSDKYTIEAKAEGLDPSPQQSADRLLMTGPMLRALLEDRFRLKLHQEIEEVPMYALKVARGGLKIKPMEPGACTNDRSNGPILLSDAARRGVKPTCGTVNGGPNGPNWRVEHVGQTLSVVATILSGTLGVKVFDRTGVTDIFNMTWEFGPDENTPGVARFFEMTGTAPSGPPTGPSVFRALQEQLGLTVEPIKGPRAYLVIDQIERPKPDAPVSARAQGARR